MRDTVAKKGKNVYDISEAVSVARGKKAVSHSARKKRRIAFVVIVGLIALLAGSVYHNISLKNELKAQREIYEKTVEATTRTQEYHRKNEIQGVYRGDGKEETQVYKAGRKGVWRLTAKS